MLIFMQVLCEKYWPLEHGSVYHGLIQVTTMARKLGPDYFITTISLRKVRGMRLESCLVPFISRCLPQL